jgi:hypothetical protein
MGDIPKGGDHYEITGCDPFFECQSCDMNPYFLIISGRKGSCRLVRHSDYLAMATKKLPWSL